MRNSCDWIIAWSKSIPYVTRESAHSTRSRPNLEFQWRISLPLIPFLRQPVSKGQQFRDGYVRGSGWHVTKMKKTQFYTSLRARLPQSLCKTFMPTQELQFFKGLLSCSTIFWSRRVDEPATREDSALFLPGKVSSTFWALESTSLAARPLLIFRTGQSVKFQFIFSGQLLLQAAVQITYSIYIRCPKSMPKVE